MNLDDIFDDSMREELSKIDKNLNKVFIYFIDMNKYRGEQTQLWYYLSVKEKQQVKKYSNRFLADRYIVSHGILRCILSYYIKQPPQSIKFIHNEYGKPFLKKSDVQFNMSHSHNIVCYVIAFNCIVGIDIEFYDNTLDIIELLELVLTSREIKLFNTVATSDKHKVFYNLWTKKESLVKAIGLGLSYPINTVETLPLISGNKIVFTSDNDYKQELYSYTLSIVPNYSGAITINRKINKIDYLKMSTPKSILGKVVLNF